MSEEANEAIEMQRELEKKIKLRTQKVKQAIQNIKSAINGMDDDATFDVDLVNGETAKLEHETIKVGDLRLILALQERQYEENGSLKLSSRNLITEMDELEEELSDYKKSYEELKEKVFKRDKELIRLEEYANKNFERKDDVKVRYIPKDKIREKLNQEYEEYTNLMKAQQSVETKNIWTYQHNAIKGILEELLEEG